MTPYFKKNNRLKKQWKLIIVHIYDKNSFSANFHLLEKTGKLASLLVLVLVTKMIISKVLVLVLVMKNINLNLLVLVLEFQKATSIIL